MAQLLIAGPDGKRSELSTQALRRLKIGRSVACDIVLSDVSLSRHHAELVRNRNRWILRDCNSRNGTLLNGERVGRPIDLHPGDVIRIGRSTLVFEPRSEGPESIELSDAGVSSQDTRTMTPVEISAAGKPDEWFDIIEDASHQLLAHHSLERLFEKLLDLVFRAVSPERAVVLSRDNDTVVCEAYRAGDATATAPVFSSIARRVFDDGVSVLMRDAQIDGALEDSSVRHGVRSLMAVPLRDEQRIIGAIYVDSRLTAGLFGDRELRLLSVLADIAAINVQNARLFQVQLKERHLEREAAAAAEIQERLLPRAAPSIPGYEFQWVNVSCYEVGGDYYDCLTLDEGRYGLALADVAGKGMGAAMLMAVMQATLRNSVGVELDALVGRLNGAIFASTPENRFVTFFFVELDPNTHCMRYVNAGHAPAPLLIRSSGVIERLAAWTIPVGLMADVSCASRRSELGPGDFVFACSDGVTDTLDPDGNLFGEERLESMLVGLRGKTAEEVRRAVETELAAYAQGTPQPDDLTMTILRRTESDSRSGVGCP